MTDIEITKLTHADLEYIWNNIRDYDLSELRLSGYRDEVPIKHLDQPMSFVGRADKEPVLAFGLYEGQRALTCWAFATPEICKYWKSATKGTRRLLNWAKAEYPDHAIQALVWDGHPVSKRWLGRLGFEPTKHRFKKNGETMTWLELRG